MNAEESRFDVAVVGAGVIGLSCAWRAAGRGLRVCLVDRGPAGAGATDVAAGMLAPVGEASWGEERLLDLNLASLERWPSFAAELEADSGAATGFGRIGALHVALDRDEAEELRRRFELHRRLGLDSEWMRPGRCRELEPSLAPGVTAGLYAPHESTADPRQVAAALLAAVRRRGCRVEEEAVISDAELSAELSTLHLADGGELRASRVVIAAGAESGLLEWLPAGTLPPVRPVKGEVVALRADGELPCSRIVAGERVYMVPRGDGRLVVGATMEEAGFDTTVTAGGVHELLREAYRVLPEIAELELAELRAGLRPGSPDNAPLIGEATPGLLVATGHFRNGVLQAPVTADAVVSLIVGEDPPVDLEHWSPGRFAGEAADGAGPMEEVAG